MEDYLFHHCLPHMEDSSNFNDDYTRNRIRHQVLPVLEELSPGFLGRMADTAALLRADEACLTGLAQELAGRAVPEQGGWPSRPSLSPPPPIPSPAGRSGCCWADCGEATKTAPPSIYTPC